MWEAIKNLEPLHRFYAFVLLAILTTGSAAVTSYLSTDDCKGISDQYEILVVNHTNLMKINNELISDNNQKQTDLINIGKTLDTISLNCKRVITKSTSVVNANPNYKVVTLVNPSVNGSDTDGDGVNDNEDKCPTVKGAIRSDGCPEAIAEEVLTTTTVIKETPIENKKAVNYMLRIVNKYKNKSTK
jgi:hypothetical protein